MSKRSDFLKIDKDKYYTPIAAVHPLIPHLPTTPFVYAEPCAGDGRLVRHIHELTEGKGVCNMAVDIEPDSMNINFGDAREIIVPLNVDLIITNPPWTRTKASGYLMHAIIENLARQAPTWLLFDADWAHTIQAKPMLEYCDKIVAIGRVRWIEDSKMSGKDNCAWYLFDNTTTGKRPTIFWGR